MEVALIAALGTPMAPVLVLVWSVVVLLVVVVHSCMFLVHLAPTCADAGPDLLQLPHFGAPFADIAVNRQKWGESSEVGHESIDMFTTTILQTAVLGTADMWTSSRAAVRYVYIPVVKIKLYLMQPMHV